MSPNLRKPNSAAPGQISKKINTAAGRKAGKASWLTPASIVINKINFGFQKDLTVVLQQPHYEDGLSK